MPYHAVKAVRVILAMQIVRQAILHSLCHICSCGRTMCQSRKAKKQSRARSFGQPTCFVLDRTGQSCCYAIAAHVPEQQDGTRAGQAPLIQSHKSSAPARQLQLRSCSVGKRAAAADQRQQAGTRFDTMWLQCLTKSHKLALSHLTQDALPADVHQGKDQPSNLK